MGVSMTVNVLGTASTGYLQNLVFHENAFALVVTPMESPPVLLTLRASPTKG